MYGNDAPESVVILPDFAAHPGTSEFTKLVEAPLLKSMYEIIFGSDIETDGDMKLPVNVDPVNVNDPPQSKCRPAPVGSPAGSLAILGPI